MDDDILAAGNGPVDRLGPSSDRPPVERPRRGRRTAITAGSAVALAAVVGSGLWAWQSWTAQGPQPAEALPGDTLAYAAIDLDPPGGQKVGALGVLKKFPSVRKELGLEGDTDLRRTAVEEFASEGSCTLDFAADVAPWLGDRAAVAVVPQDRPRTVVVLQVRDAGAAEAGLEAVRDCARKNGQRAGHALAEDWVVLAETEQVARTVVADAGARALADDPDYRSWTEAAGDPGFLTLYAAPEAGPAILEMVEKDPFAAFQAQMLVNALDPVSLMLGPAMALGTMLPESAESQVAGPDEGEWPEEPPFTFEEPPFNPEERAVLDQFEHFEELSKTEQEALLEAERRIMEKHHGSFPGPPPPDEVWSDDDWSDDDWGFSPPELPAALRASLEDFQGLGGVARFADGGVELELVSDRLAGSMSSLTDGQAGDDVLARLPAGTAMAFGAGFAPGWGQTLLEQISGGMFGMQSVEDLTAAWEQATGLELPGDLDVLAGQSVAFVADSGLDPDLLFQDLSSLRVAARIKGDPEAIEAALAKVRAALPPTDRERLVSRRVADGVVVGPDTAYVDEVADGGDLGSTSRFRDVVRDAGSASAVAYVDFDAGDWLVRAADTAGRADVEPLEALGMTRWIEDDRERMVVRLTVAD